MCYRLFYKKNTGEYFPCGKCPKCITRRTSAWSFRLMQEDLVSQSSDFITLTYDTKHVPIHPSGWLSLDKSDLQLFFKRLRKAQSGNGVSPIKYYAVGEYGGRTQRPHYHILLFNAKFELIDKAWNKGMVYYGKVSGASVGYTLKYMSKHKRDKRPAYWLQPEFALMSKGLGKNYLTEAMKNYHFADLINRMYCTTLDGIKLSMPRYYKDKMYSDLQRGAIKEAQSIIMHEKQLEKLSKQTLKDVRNEQAAIDAAFDRMYRSSLKTVL